MDVIPGQLAFISFVMSVELFPVLYRGSAFLLWRPSLLTYRLRYPTPGDLTGQLVNHTGGSSTGAISGDAFFPHIRLYSIIRGARQQGMTGGMNIGIGGGSKELSCFFTSLMKIMVMN
jgi:hypothetical protein